ncbi:MAG TPA: SIMPL domain-containing protein [Caulobacter sp.]|nr:SIMPL domain-containing protein [Caulobacter sp.]
MRNFLIAAAITVLSAGGALAQSADTAQIVVSGSGEAEAPADWAAVSIELVGEGPTAVVAVNALTGKQTQLEARIKSLAKASSVGIQTGDLTVSAIRGADCEDARGYRPRPVLSEGVCTVKGYAALMKIEVRITPASEAGNVASLATELGALDATLSGYGLDHPELLAEQATRDAIEDARFQAMTIARASNVRLGPVVRIQMPSSYADPELDVAVADAAASDAAAAPLLARPPAATIDITPPPVKAAARLSVIYSVLP